MGYTPRLETIEDADGETEGVLIERGEVRIEVICVQTLLKIHTLADAAQ